MTSANRIVKLYDPSKVYSLIFKDLSSDAELGDYSLGNTVSRYDYNFWSEM